MLNQTKNKQTILYLVTQSELGGAQRYVLDLAENLKTEFNVAVAFGEQREKGELAAKLKNVNIKFYSLPHLKRLISPWNDFLALLEIIKLIKKTKPDIIHLNSSKISILGSLAFAFIRMFAISGIRIYSRISVIYTVHGWVFNEPMPAWKKTFYKYAEKFTALFKDELICVSEFDKQTAIKEKICNPKKLITIHNGIQPINFLPKEEVKQKLSEKIQNSIPHNIAGQNSKLLIGTIANLYPAKGLEYLIQAVKQLSTFNFQLLTIIIGEGEERKNLESLIAQMNLKNNVILTGKIDNAAELLRGFDIFVCSSVKEGFPYAILEAMSAGLPIVSSNVGGIADMINNNQNGLLAKTKNSRDLAEKIIKIINNPELGQKLGAQAKKDIEEKFSFDNMVEKTKEVYLK